MPKDGRARCQQLYKRGDCKRKQVADAEHRRFPDHVKRQAVQMRIWGASIFAAARVVGASVTAVSRWLGKGDLRVNG